MQLPSEWKAAYESSKLLSEFINKHEGDNLVSKWLINVIFIAIAFIISIFISLDHFFIKSTLMVIGILTGFVINTLIFIGRDGRVNLLSLEDSKEYAEKIKFLLWTQLGTLKVFLTYISVALVYLIFAKENFPTFLFALQVCLLWLLTFGLVRTLLLPLQIYDLHAFNLEQLIKEKEAEAKKSLEKVKKQE